jgi:hypothetical protein
MSKKNKGDDSRREAPSSLNKASNPQAKSHGLKKLTKAWQKASAPERAEFLDKLGARQSEAANETLGRPIANGRYLLPAGVARIEQVMIRRGIRPDAVMAELGFAGQGQALTRALAKGASLRLAVIARLEDWLAAEKREQ